jgi:3'(2'), 5'-bisphosphate nucleotidase
MKSMRQDSEGINEISVRDLKGAPVILGSVSHSSPRDRTFADAIGEHVFEGVGSSMKICRVAEGSADMAPRFGTTSCWDTAAAHAVLNAAGGCLLGPDGDELDYDLVEEILNPWFLATSSKKWVNLWVKHQV